MHTNNNYEAAAILFPLLNLSPEIVGMVIEEIDDMQTFISVSQTCSSLRSICRNERIVKNLFASCHGGHKPEQQAAKIYINLKFAARCSFLAPTSVENAFREAWPVFRDLQMEEVLYPVAMALANHYFSLGLAKEGKLFLERIWNYHEPYEVEISRMVSPGLLPIAKRLRQLAGKGLAHQVIQSRISLLEQFEKTRKQYFMSAARHIHHADPVLNMSQDILLNISDPQAMGVHMKTLIDLWVEHGLTDGQFLALEYAQNVTQDLDIEFIQALAHEKLWYDTVYSNIFLHLENWEELPAWHEVCLLKGYFDRSPNFAQSLSASTKRSTLIMIKAFSQDLYMSECSLFPLHSPGNLVPYFWKTSRWYQAKFHQYQDRQFSKLYSLERSVRASLASGGSLYIVVAEDVYPPAWSQAMRAWGNPEE
ncbi:hypothetical protein FOFC_17960 [Fusarium oxysporum]|nr:hypothetical protein FOFC_17960 [Fusarium oxysporum]